MVEGEEGEEVEEEEEVVVVVVVVLLFWCRQLELEDLKLEERLTRVNNEPRFLVTELLQPCQDIVHSPSCASYTTSYPARYHQSYNALLLQFFCISLLVLRITTPSFYESNL